MELAQVFGFRLGVAMAFTQEERVKYGKRHGYETNYNRNIQSEAFSLAGKKYRKALMKLP